MRCSAGVLRRRAPTPTIATVQLKSANARCITAPLIVVLACLHRGEGVSHDGRCAACGLRPGGGGRAQSRCRCGSGVGPVPVQMRQGWASPSADVQAVSKVPVQMWQGEPHPGAGMRYVAATCSMMHALLLHATCCSAQQHCADPSIAMQRRAASSCCKPLRDGAAWLRCCASKAVVDTAASLRRRTRSSSAAFSTDSRASLPLLSKSAASSCDAFCPCSCQRHTLWPQGLRASNGCPRDLARCATAPASSRACARGRVRPCRRVRPSRRVPTW